MRDTNAFAWYMEQDPLLRSTVGDEIDQKSRLINEAAAKLKERPSDGPDASVRSAPPNSSGAPGRGREVASTVDRGVSTAGIREKSSSWLLPVGAGLAVLAVAVVLAKGTIGNTPPEPVVTAPAVTAPAAPTPPVTTTAVAPSEARPAEPAAPEPVRDVRITVRTIPSNASIQVDDGPAVNAPYTLDTSPSSTLRTIRASAPSYLTSTREVLFDQTREIVIELAPAPGQRRVKPRGKQPESSLSGTPSVDVTPVAPREPGTLPPKKPRALDEDNPFAG